MGNLSEVPTVGFAAVFPPMTWSISFTSQGIISVFNKSTATGIAATMMGIVTKKGSFLLRGCVTTGGRKSENRFDGGAVFYRTALLMDKYHFRLKLYRVP